MNKQSEFTKLIDIQAERAVIGACMMDPTAMTRIAATLLPTDFYRDANRHLYEAMQTLADAQKPIDPVTLMDELTRRGKVDVVGGLPEIQAIAFEVPSAMYVEHYAHIVADRAIMRRLSGAAGEIAKTAFKDDMTAQQAIDEAERILLAVTAGKRSRTMEHISRPLQRVIDGLDMAMDGLSAGIPTGFGMLDRLLGGFQRSDLIICAARPGMGKCFGKGAKVLMHDGSLKAVEDVVVGDLVMGPDSKPRRVLTLARGQEMMYWVHQRFGISYRVNESHVISLKRSKNEGKWRHGDVINVPVSDIKDKGPGFFSRFKGYKTAVEFPEKPLPIDPYLLGLWLGDGTSTNGMIHNMDHEVIEHLHAIASDRQEFVKVQRNTHSNCKGYLITGGRTQVARNASFQATLSRAGLIGNKHIPDDYIVNSKANRLQLLAGLIDSDGHYFKTDDQGGPYEITLKNKSLAEQIKFLCDSLGYRTSIKQKWAQAQTGARYVAYRVRFNGNVDEIPAKIERKKALPWGSCQDWQVSGISIEADKVDDYFGFSVDGDHLFLLEDMTVTHNSSFALSIADHAARRHNAKIAIFSLEMSKEQLVQRLLSMRTGIDSHRIRMRQIHDDEWTTIMEVANEIRQTFVHIDDTAGQSVDAVRREARRMYAEGSLDMIVIDYMQLLTGTGQNREQEISYISRNLKAMAKELNVPVLALSQLSRAVESRADKRPMLSDLRESGSQEQDADAVLFIYRDDYYHEDSDRPNIADILLAKHRHGATGTVSLFFRKELTQFKDLEIERTDLNDY